MRAACSRSNGYGGNDREVADGELHVEVVDRVEQMSAEERNTLYV